MRCGSVGPSDAKLLLIGEAPGSEEERRGEPFVGESGKELTKCLREAGIDRAECYLTNVFHDRPPGNKFHDAWCRGKKEVSEAYLETRPRLKELYPGFDWPNTYTWAPVSTGKYVMPQHLGELPRLYAEIKNVKPNLVVTLGGTPTWALLGVGGISKLRGTVVESSKIPGQKVLPTWHPAYIQRVWNDRVTLVMDLTKAKGEMEFPDIRRPSRKIWVLPTIQDIYTFSHNYIESCSLLAFDTETAHKQITCISFAPNKDIAIVVPFVDRSKPDYNYWEKAEDEAAAWAWVRDMLALPMPKLAQNGLYDLQYLWWVHGIPVFNYFEDTMLLHHSLFIELKKDLGFLGSIYTDESSWKLMRPRAKDMVEKKDD